MIRKSKRVFGIILSIMLMMSSTACSFKSGENSETKKWEYLIEGVSEVKNVILMIGDGFDDRVRKTEGKMFGYISDANKEKERESIL